MHSLSASFVLAYHGCAREIGERLLRNEPFRPSENDYDWLGSGIYFWEANPDRALEWAQENPIGGHTSDSNRSDPFVVGAVIDLGYCLDLISSSGIEAVESAFGFYRAASMAMGFQMPENSAGPDHLLRKLDCAVINFLHFSRQESLKPPFDTVRGLFPEGELLYPHSSFRRKTHVQICVRNSEAIKGVFRVPDRHFTPVASA